jgi:uncharacterized sulfatase
MSMKRWIALAGLLLAGCAAPAAVPPSRPNLVLIISDDQGWGDYGFMGHAQIRTPRLDRLASESLVFPRGYVTSSLCCPSLASILSGHHPHRTGIYFNDPPRPPGMKGGEFYKSPEYEEGRTRTNAFMERLETLPRVLSRAGYRSFQTGKWWQGHFSTGGFTEGMSLGGRHGDAGLDIGRKSMKPVEDFVDASVAAKAPFLLWYAPMLPHQPHTPPERLLGKYRGKGPSLHVEKYWAMVEWFDETCGQLLDLLEQRGLSKDTVVVYVTDNGWVQDPAKASFMRSKRTPYDAGVRTPIMVRWPGRVVPGRDERPVSAVDLAPTLFRAAGVEPPAGLPGLDLLGERRHEAVFGATYTHDAVDLDRPASGLESRWVVEGDWKLILPAQGAAELYHLKADPDECQDLLTVEPAKAGALRRRIESWWTP